MKQKSGMVKRVILFMLVVVVDFLIIQGMRMITPRVAVLRLSIIFAVFAASIIIYIFMIKPKDAIKAGIVLSIACFLTALAESVIIHVLIEKSVYQPMYLIPSGFALLLPFAAALIYKKVPHNV